MIAIMEEAARAAGKILLKQFKHYLLVSDKTSQHNLVTDADLQSQKIICEIIIQKMVQKGYAKKDIGFIGEENLTKSGKYVFVIDPLDGTSNYASGLDEFAVSIGLFVDGVLEHGVIYHPLHEEILYASKGKGAWRVLNGKRTKIHIAKTNLRDTVFCGSLSKDVTLRRKQIHMYQALFPHFRGFIAVNAFVPSVFVFLDHTNTVGLIFESKGYLWDVAAIKIIIEEAGGILAGWNGKEVRLDTQSLHTTYPSFACHPDNLSEILRILA